MQWKRGELMVGMASTKGLVPITRSFLAKYYDKYPFLPISDDVYRLTTKLRELVAQLLEESLPLSPSDEHLLREMDAPLCLKIDENLWKNREHIEEILFLLKESQWPRSLQQKATSDHVELANLLRKLEAQFQSIFKILESFQLKNAESVSKTVMTYLPQDFRCSLILKQRERSERKRKAEVDTLVASGGTIRDRYTLLWKQQMDRRMQLAQLGSASGIYKVLVKYLVGVPQVLLNFVKQINDEHGPMEEQRLRYGPSLCSLVKMILSLQLFLVLSWKCFDSRKLQKDQISVLEHAANIYSSEFERFLAFMSDVFKNSPFLISAEEAGIAKSRIHNDYKKKVIPVGQKHEVSMTIDALNTYITWDFSLEQGTISLDIGFSVEYVSPSGETSLILPYRRCTSDQGNFCTLLVGSYKLIWDNSYSTFFKKSLSYKVDAIPPIEETSHAASGADV